MARRSSPRPVRATAWTPPGWPSPASSRAPPKLLAVRGMTPATANLAASMLWLGLAVGCFFAPWISDRLRRRKLPVLVGTGIQILALGALLLAPSTNAVINIALCFAFG